jgi:hypothetical protein
MKCVRGTVARGRSLDGRMVATQRHLSYSSVVFTIFVLVLPHVFSLLLYTRRAVSV